MSCACCPLLIPYEACLSSATFSMQTRVHLLTSALPSPLLLNGPQLDCCVSQESNTDVFKFSSLTVGELTAAAGQLCCCLPFFEGDPIAA